jgi:hypothetical protein
MQISYTRTLLDTASKFRSAPTADLQTLADACRVGMFTNYLRTTFHPFGSTCSIATTMTYLASIQRRRGRSWQQAASYRAYKIKPEESKESCRDRVCSHMAEPSSSYGGLC